MSCDWISSKLSLFQICVRYVSTTEREKVIHGIQCCGLPWNLCIKWSCQRGISCYGLNFGLISQLTVFVSIWMLDFMWNTMANWKLENNLRTTKQQYIVWLELHWYLTLMFNNCYDNYCTWSVPSQWFTPDSIPALEFAVSVQ